MTTAKEEVLSADPPVGTTLSQTEEPPYAPAVYAWYVVGVLTLVYIFSFIDRQILTLLVAPIRRDLQISDTQMSLLMGFSFVFFYTLCGIPFGRLADSKNRRAIIAIGFVAWSMMTALCGVARNFTHLFACRIGVGVGEATLGPAAFSIITDYFRKERLATAISVYSMGIYIGAGLAYLLGGLVIGFASSQEMYELPIVGATRSWQLIFFLIGLPGIFLALLLYTVKEPVRRGRQLMPAGNGKVKATSLPARQVWNYILANKATFICHNVGFGLIALSTNAGGSWNPAYFQRSHGWQISKIGIVMGAILAIAGTAGIVLAGRLSDWLFERGYKDAPLRVGMGAALLLVPVGTMFYLAPSGTVAAWLYVPLAFLASAPFGVAPAAIQQMMPNEMRGQASAIYMFVVNVIGLGMGPTLVAMLNDFVFHDDFAIRYSLLIVGSAAQFLAAFFLWRGMKPFTESIDRLLSWKNNPV